MKEIKPEEINVILATDCGSTTTKAILIERKGNDYRLIVRGEAPTTVEAPFEDVTMGVLNAVGEVEELTGRKLLDEKTAEHIRTWIEASEMEQNRARFSRQFKKSDSLF